MLTFLIWLTISMFVMAISEYWIHRLFMHKKFSWVPKWIFEDHAIQHHHEERFDINVDLPIYIHLIIGSPLIVLFWLISWKAVIALLLTFAFHSYIWTKLHRAIHGLEINWLSKMWFYPILAEHHLAHHDRPGKNFGVVFIFTDYLFGTNFKKVKK